MRELQAGFDGDRACAETYVPKNAAAIQFQCLQGKEADRSFGNHAGTSVQVGKLFVGKTEGTGLFSYGGLTIYREESFLAMGVVADRLRVS